MENYFNYFTEIEEYFWKKRGTMLLLSTLDWALIDSWKQAQVPMEVVLKGIDRSFEKFQSRRQKVRQVNSLAYCHQEVLTAAQECERSALHHPSSGEPFPRDELVKFLENNVAALEKAGQQFAAQGRSESAATLRSIAASLGEMAARARADDALDVEETERRLGVLEDKLLSVLMQTTEEAELVRVRADMDRALAPYRGKIARDQLPQLEKQFLQRKLLEKAGLPRLSLFYL